MEHLVWAADAKAEYAARHQTPAVVLVGPSALDIALTANALLDVSVLPLFTLANTPSVPVVVRFSHADSSDTDDVPRCSVTLASSDIKMDVIESSSDVHVFQPSNAARGLTSQDVRSQASEYARKRITAVRDPVVIDIRMDLSSSWPRDTSLLTVPWPIDPQSFELAVSVITRLHALVVFVTPSGLPDKDVFSSVMRASANPMRRPLFVAVGINDVMLRAIWLWDGTPQSLPSINEVIFRCIGDDLIAMMRPFEPDLSVEALAQRFYALSVAELRTTRQKQMESARGAVLSRISADLATDQSQFQLFACDWLQATMRNSEEVLASLRSKSLQVIVGINTALEALLLDYLTPARIIGVALETAFPFIEGDATTDELFDTLVIPSFVRQLLDRISRLVHDNVTSTAEAHVDDVLFECLKSVYTPAMNLFLSLVHSEFQADIEDLARTQRTLGSASPSRQITITVASILTRAWMKRVTNVQDDQIQQMIATVKEQHAQQRAQFQGVLAVLSSLISSKSVPVDVQVRTELGVLVTPLIRGLGDDCGSSSEARQGVCRRVAAALEREKGAIMRLAAGHGSAMHTGHDE